MFAVWLKLVTILYFCCTALSSSENNGAIWKDPGASITIQCRSPSPDQDYLYLRKGLNGFEVLCRNKKSGNDVVKKGFKSRLQTYGDFPDLDILIKNLTSDDTDPYWCEYEKIKPTQPQKTKGKGSVLLVVNRAFVAQQCEEQNKSLVLVSVVISGVVLLSFLLAFFAWIIKTKILRATVKPQRVSNNDVYEDMRGTIRR